MKTTKKVFLFFLLIASSVLIVHGALSIRPWNDGGFDALPGATKIADTNTWVGANISQRDTLTVEPWNVGGYAGWTEAVQQSEQRDWQYLKRRATDTEKVEVYSSYERVVNSSTTNEYFVPDKTSTEWLDARASIVAGEVPDLSLEYCGRASMSVTDDSTCSLNSSGNVYCWGLSGSGQLGNGSTSPNLHTPGIVSGGYTWKTLADGDSDQHHCAINTNDDLYCWGEGAFGRLGDGSTAINTTPGIVSGGHKWKMATAGDYNSCGITTDGVLYCWGEGLTYATGNGSTTDRTTPFAVSGGGTWTHVGLGREHGCGLKTGGIPYCWGQGLKYTDPVIGNGSTAAQPTPVLVSGGHTFIDLKVGEHHACGLEADGDLYCWGKGSYGQMGDGSNTNNSTPALVSGGHAWKKDGFGLGEWSTCAIRESDDKLYCWGFGNFGVLGTGGTSNYNVPTASADTGTWSSVAPGFYYGCGIKTNGAAYCWGRNDFGELGTGNFYTDQMSPTAVVGGQTYVSEYCEV